MIKLEVAMGLYNNSPSIRHFDENCIDSDDIWGDLDRAIYNMVSLRIDKEVLECASHCMFSLHIWIANNNPLKEMLLEVIEEYEKSGYDIDRTPLMSGWLYEIIWR